MLRNHAAIWPALVVTIVLFCPALAQAQTDTPTATPNACATDAADRWETVLAYESPTPSDTPTPTPTPTATPWLACDISSIAIAAGDTMTVPYTIYNEYYGPGAHSVSLSFFVDHERVAIVMTSLPDPTGVNSAQRAVDWRAAWNDGVHEVLLIVESSEYAPLEAECTQWFGNADFVPALECDIGATVNYSDTELTLSRTVYYTTDLDTHHVNGYFYVDNVLVYDAMYNLVSTGVATGTSVVELQPRHLWGQHEVHYVLESEQHAPLAAECYAHFGAPVDVEEVHVNSAGETWIYRREVSMGDDAVGARITDFGVPVLLVMVVGGMFAFWYRRRKPW